ncbi:hypothetical protein OSB04_000044 [Centaurea solstitialis]|uniref:DUF4283 domain-containing protein n=1 Tax=Centaurea solstitialis TaxID=347529 RepID=A0AA38TVS9_9ASTR|nr:hypothetical protein OSB04_000044 [Centaurea solstitialis]
MLSLGFHSHRLRPLGSKSCGGGRIYILYLIMEANRPPDPPITRNRARKSKLLKESTAPSTTTTTAVPVCGDVDGDRLAGGSQPVVADYKTNTTITDAFFSLDRNSPLPSTVSPLPAAELTATSPLMQSPVLFGGAVQPAAADLAEPIVETPAETSVNDVGSFQQLLRDVSGIHGHHQPSSADVVFSSFLASPVGMGSSRGVLPTASVSNSEAATLSSPTGSQKPSVVKEEKPPNAGSFVDSEGKVHLHADETVGTHKPVSFADLLKKSANLVCGKGKLTYYPPVVTELGTRRAIIPDELVHKQASEWALTLAGYFIGKRPAFPFVQFHARRMWKKYGLTDVILNDQGYFFFKFNSDQGLNFVFENGPWLLNGMPIFIQRWQPGLCFDKPELKSVPLWVNIYGLPLDVWDYEIISRIASVVGEPVSVDRYTDEMCETKSGRANFARVLVNVSADYELPSDIDAIILGKLRKFKTEFLWKPKRCSHCKAKLNDENPSPKAPKFNTERIPMPVKVSNKFTVLEEDPQWILDKKEIDDFIVKRGVGLEPVIINSWSRTKLDYFIGRWAKVFGKEPDGTLRGFTLPDRQIISDDEGSDTDSEDDADKDASSDATLGTPYGTWLRQKQDIDRRLAERDWPTVTQMATWTEKQVVYFFKQCEHLSEADKQLIPTTEH